MDVAWQLVVALSAALAMCPAAFFWECWPCCDKGCEVADGKPRTDPKNEGTWVPSGTWRGAGGVTWTFTANPGDESGETWFFYGSAGTSRPGGSATVAEQQDWDNICNWYSNKTTEPSDDSSGALAALLNKRATRLPTQNAIVHAYTSVSTSSAGPQTVKNMYFWTSDRFVRPCELINGSEITTTSAAHDSSYGAVFAGGSRNKGTLNNGALFYDGFFYGAANVTTGVVNGGAVFLSAINTSTVNGGAMFYGIAQNQAGPVNDGATFFDTSENTSFGVVNGGATFNDSSENSSLAVVNGGATFNDSSKNDSTATVNDGATFNDSACSQRTVGSFGPPCTRRFVVHPTDLPTCNGTASSACTGPPFPGCGCR